MIQSDVTSQCCPLLTMCNHHTVSDAILELF